MLERELPRMIRVSNGYAGEIPAFSAVLVSSANFRTVTVTRPNADHSNRIMFTGLNVIKNGGVGHASCDFPLWVETTGSPAAGDEVGASNGAFTLAKNNRGFKVLAMSGTRALVCPSWAPTGGSDGQVLKLTGAVPGWAAASGGGVTVGASVLGSSAYTGASPIIEATLGADGDYLVWFYAKITAASGPCRALLKYTAGMDTYSVGQAHGYVSHTTEGQTLFGMTQVTSWDNDNTLNLYCEMWAGTGTVNAAWTGMSWLKY